MTDTPPFSPLPESPIILDAFASPEIRGEPSVSRLKRAPSLRAAHTPRVLTHPSSETILPVLQQEEEDASGGSSNADGPSSSAGNSARGALVLRHALEWAVEYGDTELLAWLAGLDGRWAEVLDDEVAVLEDEEGWGLVGIAIQASCGRQEKEESVRTIVGRWGLECGPRSGRDRTGWTPLHLATLISTPPLVSFLLTRGASPESITNRGLTPLDLIAGMEDRQHVSLILGQAAAQGPSSRPIFAHARGPAQIESADPSVSESRKRLLRRRRERVERDTARAEGQAKREQVRMQREKWVAEKVRAVGVDPDSFGLTPTAGADSWCGEEDEDTDADTGLMTDDLELVFSLAQLPALLDILVKSYQPTCHPLPRRSVPANTIYLYARFAHYRCDDAWLEELLETAVERIEQGVYTNVEDLAYLAFWAYNTTLLLHLLTLDEKLRNACDELGLLGMLEELINAVHVFVIRVAERRIDAVLDAALLDYETLEDFDDVRFEGEWTLFRNFGTKKQRGTILKSAQQGVSDFGMPNGQPNGNDASVSSPSNIFNSIRNGVSPFKGVQTRQSNQDLRTMFNRSESNETATPATPLRPAAAPVISPASITDILTGVLVVLQIYEVNPVITVQAFSQIFFWIASEMFNRILTRKKYLCRSKAVQIRMNITSLDDWVRLNGLPAKTAALHLEPVTQLLQWLQTQSSIQTFDHLIGTTQGLRSLNPLQLRRAINDYRFEVNEGRMDDECVTYLGQMQQDWERRRVQTSVKALQAKRESGDGSGTAPPAIIGATPGMAIDELFSEDTSLSDFIPQGAPESFSELLDSRFMLPFQLPNNSAFLVATPPKDAVYNNLNLVGSPFLSDAGGSRASIRSSISASRSLAYVIPDDSKLRELPEDFFAWMKSQEAEKRQGKEKAGLQPALDPPLGPSARVNATPLRPAEKSTVKEINTTPRPTVTQPLAPVQEDENATPTGTVVPSFAVLTRSPQPASPIPAFPSPGLQTSPSLGLLREKAQMQVPFQPVSPNPNHSRSESYELRLRRAVNTVQLAKEKPTPPPSPKPLPKIPPGRSSQSASLPHYQLAREVRAQSVSSPPRSPFRTLTSPISANAPPLPPSRQNTYPASAPISYYDRPQSGESFASSVTSPISPRSETSAGAGAGKKRWWKIGGGRREGSSDSYDGSGSDGTLRSLGKASGMGVGMGMGMGIEMGMRSPTTRQGS